MFSVTELLLLTNANQKHWTLDKRLEKCQTQMI